MRKTNVFLPLLLGLAASAPLAAQAPRALARAIETRDRALEQGDMATWERFTAPALTVIDESGRLLDRSGYFVAVRQELGSPGAGQPLIYVDGIRVTSGGVPAVACSREYVTVLTDGKAAARRCLKGTTWWLEVWEKSGGGWQAVAVQATDVDR